MESAMKQTVASYFKMPKLPVSVAGKAESEAELKKYTPSLGLTGGDFFGIEVEVERVPTQYWKSTNTWAAKEDGSLRDYGVEYVTTPIQASFVEQALIGLFGDILPSGYNFSKRTSIHVHMNVREMELEGVLSLIYLYLVFEKLFYRYVDKERENSIFCVPLYKTDMIHTLGKMEAHGFTALRWMKYCGFNLLPLTNYGTIEFRHMQGNDDIRSIVTWIALMQKLKHAAQRIPLNVWKARILDLNTSSQYRILAEDVFQEYASIFTSMREFQRDMEEGSTIVKRDVLRSPLYDILWRNASYKSDALIAFYGVDWIESKLRKEEEALKRLRKQIDFEAPQFMPQGEISTFLTGAATADTPQSIWAEPQAQPGDDVNHNQIQVNW